MRSEIVRSERLEMVQEHQYSRRITLRTVDRTYNQLEYNEIPRIVTIIYQNSDIISNTE